MKPFFPGWLVVALFLTPASLPACKCLVSWPVCNEAAVSDLVFIGTVESIEPVFLDPWDPAGLAQLPTGEILRLQQEGSPASLAKLKGIYAQLYPNMPEPWKSQMQSASTHGALETVIESIQAQGKQARIRVTKYFKKPADDDLDPAKDRDSKDGDGKQEEITVWTPSDDCGYNFQKGETYLVYADSDEETGRIETSICNRTQRLTDAGADLAYLYFLDKGRDKSTRLEGFVTDEANQDIPRFADAVHSPVPGVVMQLESSAGSRYARTGADGRFIFDGLSAGPYSLTAFGSAYPKEVRQLVDPAPLQLQTKSCGRHIVVVPAGNR